VNVCFKGKVIGSGKFSIVYDGYIETGKGRKEIAWKIPNIENEEEIKALLKELKTLSIPALVHKNVCRMLTHVNIEG